MTDISVHLRERLKENFCINGLFVRKRLESAIDNTVKYLYRLSDGNFVETVLMEYSYGHSICVSTQVGCKMGCRFCASAIAGYVRSLAPSEILMQIYETEKDAGVRVSGVVLMGIGEPLDNYDNVVKFLRLVSDKDGNNLSLRHVTLSTCGIVPRIYDLARLKLGLTLSVSLHCPDNEKRSEIIPVNKKYDIAQLIEACKHYIAVTGRRVTFEYAVIDDVNSSEKDADELAALLRGMNCHVNLIPVNKVKERSYHTARAGVAEFAKRLGRRGINATVRRTLGSDIEAACGQLRRDAAQHETEGGADI
jgi:23S rRNA (adenine2503-C2)-methyltransferase